MNEPTKEQWALMSLEGKYKALVELFPTIKYEIIPHCKEIVEMQLDSYFEDYILKPFNHDLKN